MRKTDLAVVNPHDAPNHLWDDDHITEVRLDDGGLLIGGCLLLGLAQLFDETHWSTLETALEAAAHACMDELRR